MEKVPFFPMTTSHDRRGDDDLLVYTIYIHVLEPIVEFLIPPDFSPPSDPARPPIIHVYSRKPRPTLETDLVPPASTRSTDDTSNTKNDEVTTSHIELSDLDLPMTLRKGQCYFTYPIASYVSYDNLSTSSCSLVATLDSISIPKTVGEALAHPGWRAAMINEMNALEQNDT